MPWDLFGVSELYKIIWGTSRSCRPSGARETLDPGEECRNGHIMKSHLFIASGLLMAAVFFMRGLDALSNPGLGLREMYIIGGFLIAGGLIYAGLKERRQRRKS